MSQAGNNAHQPSLNDSETESVKSGSQSIAKFGGASKKASSDGNQEQINPANDTSGVQALGSEVVLDQQRD